MVAPSHLKAFQALEAALRAGSLKNAAEELAITPAAIGQRIKALEDYLGIDLLARGRSGLAPTPALLGAMAHLRAAFRELETAADLLDLQRGHDIHIAAAPDFADLWLLPRLAQFRAAHPNIRFCVNGEGEAPLRLGAADCEIGFAAPAEDPDMVPLFRDFVLPIGSPENVRRIAALGRRDRLEGFPLLHLDFYKDDPLVPDWTGWIAANRLRRDAPERGIRFRRIAPIVEAVRADAGLALCGVALIAGMVDDGRLSLPFPVATGSWSAGLFQARFRGNALLRPQMARFRAWLLREADLTRAWLDAYAGDSATASTSTRQP